MRLVRPVGYLDEDQAMSSLRIDATKPKILHLEDILPPAEPGYWLLYGRRGGVLVPARIWWCDHEPYEPSNKLDRWPVPFLAAEIAGRWVEVVDVWHRVCLMRSPLMCGHWKATHPIIPKDGLTEEQEYAYLMASLTYALANALEEPIARPYKEANLRALPLPF